jgi:predicted component of type VI protein secretion system
MALDIKVCGPGLDVVRRLEAGDHEIILGRDADCGVCLPDPQRNVSRRHLSIWLEKDELQFRVLSVVNGIEMPFGEAPPGARGVLPLGQTLRLGDYSVSAAAAATDQPVQIGASMTPSDTDPWAVFDREGSGIAPISDASRASLAPGQMGEFPAPAALEDDPFGEWGFETTSGPGVKAQAPVHGAGMEAGDLAAFFRGLGLEPSSLDTGKGELETIGGVVRILVLGVLELHVRANGVKQELHADGRTMMAPNNNNPLRSNWPEQAKLRYLFGGRAAAVGFISPERAVCELLAELIAHNGASAKAAGT